MADGSDKKGIRWSRPGADCERHGSRTRWIRGFNRHRVVANRYNRLPARMKRAPGLWEHHSAWCVHRTRRSCVLDLAGSLNPMGSRSKNRKLVQHKGRDVVVNGAQQLLILLCEAKRRLSPTHARKREALLWVRTRNGNLIKYGKEFSPRGLLERFLLVE